MKQFLWYLSRRELSQNHGAHTTGTGWNENGSQSKTDNVTSWHRLLHQKNCETGVNQPLSTANIPSHHLNCSLIYADVHWVLIKHLLCAGRHGVPLWVKARGRLSSGSTESHVHSGKASTMPPPPQSKGPHGFSPPWLPQEIYQAPPSLQNEDSRCVSVSGLQGGCSGLWKVTGDSNGCWWSPLRTEEDTGCHGRSGCWAKPFS